MVGHASSRWDAEAATFDREADHGLLDPAVRAAWASLLLPLMPPGPCLAADIGCGTGSLSVLLAEAGHSIFGVDFSAEMLAVAREKARRSGVVVEFMKGEAEAPPLPPEAFDVVLARHVLWALTDPGAALRSWVELLKPNGALILIEGAWSTGAGLTATECTRLVRDVHRDSTVHWLDDATLWGKPVLDERYMVISRT